MTLVAIQKEKYLNSHAYSVLSCAVLPPCHSSSVSWKSDHIMMLWVSNDWNLVVSRALFTSKMGSCGWRSDPFIPDVMQRSLPVPTAALRSLAIYSLPEVASSH